MLIFPISSILSTYLCCSVIMSDDDKYIPHNQSCKYSTWEYSIVVSLIRGCPHIASANFRGFQTPSPPLVSNCQQLPYPPSSSPNSGKISRFEFSVIVKRAKKKKMADASVLYFILRNGFDFIESVLRCRGILDDPGLFSAILGYFRLFSFILVYSRLFSFILVYYGGKCGRSEVMAHCWRGIGNAVGR